MYRAHLTVYGTENKPLGTAGLKKAFSPLAVGGHAGTRSGHPGIWIERDTAESFRRAVETVAKFALETGYRFSIGCTSATAKVQADTATYSRLGLAARERKLIWTGRA